MAFTEQGVSMLSSVLNSSRANFSLLLVIAFVLLAGCRYKEQENKNVIFKTHEPTSNEYKQELVQQVMSNKSDFTYVFNRYLVIDGQEYIEVRFMKKNFVAMALILVKDWTKMAQLRKVKGISYKNAEIRGLKFGILTNNPHSNFLYKDHDSIVD